jgi:RNA-directed DNA polymerase
MHRPLNETGKWLAGVMRGYTRYYAVPRNMKVLKEFYTQLGRLWIHAIRRRSQKAKARWTWNGSTDCKRDGYPAPE